jgi:hypothetical protein
MTPKPTSGESARFHLSDYRLVARHNFRVSSPGESHPEALAELYVSLSTHTAPIMEPRRDPICQWANKAGARREMHAIKCFALRR